MRKIKLTIQYQGTNYQGWQVQPNGPTLQGIFEKILSEILHEKINLFAAGRTDAGVHALAQVAHFSTSHDIDLTTLHRALNAQLPYDIAVSSLEEVAKDFDAQKSAKAKTYTYFVLHADHKSPFLSSFSWRIYGALDIAGMRRCLEMLVGEHDFAAFKAADSTAKTSVRKLLAARLQVLALSDLGKSLQEMLGLNSMLPSGKAAAAPLEAEGMSELMAINFQGQGFLKHMIRNIVGTLVEVGLGKRSVEDFQRVFLSRDRTLAGPTAPAWGLVLVKVDYQ